MVLDTATLRLAFGLMALVLGLLFYFSAYRVTRSPYSGWWCLALVFSCPDPRHSSWTERPINGGPIRWVMCCLSTAEWQSGRVRGPCARSARCAGFSREYRW